MTGTEIREVMEQVGEGEEVVWDNTDGDTRVRSQPIVEVTDSYFIVEVRRGGKNKFFKNSDEPKLENLNMNREYTLARFEIE